jgi:hypothetical protein
MPIAIIASRLIPTRRLQMLNVGDLVRRNGGGTMARLRQFG